MVTGVSNPSYIFLDRHHLQSSKTEELHLSIELGLNEVSYTIKNDDRVLAIEHINENLSIFEEKIKNHEWLSKKFKSTNVCLLNQKSTLIPDSLFDLKNKANYVSFNHEKTENHEVLHDKIEPINSYNVYGISSPVKQLIETHFRDATIRHHSSSLIVNWINLYKNNDEKKLIVNIQNQSFQLMMIDKMELKFFNSFRFQHNNDFIYHLLFAMEQLKLDSEKIKLYLYGDILKESDLYQLIYSYIRNVEFGNRNSLIQLSPVADHIEKHQNFTLLHQHLCV
tara:strand:+ start:16683 stop:17525 length:843 start_codon:yes stop_codon:yes gene_type:complete